MAPSTPPPPLIAEGTAQHALLHYTYNGIIPDFPAQATAEPGWYPSPVGGGWRWFNGEQWTFHTRPVAPKNRRRPPRRATPLWAHKALDEYSRTPTLLHHNSKKPRYVAAVAALVVALGTLTAGYTAWQLWGTNWQAEAAQERLAEDLATTGDERFTPANSTPPLPTQAVPGTPAAPLDEAIDTSAAAAGITVESVEPATIWNNPDDPAFANGTDTGVLAVEEHTRENITPFPPAGWQPPAGRETTTQPANDGAALGRLRVPAANIDMVITSGTSEASLNSGAGVWREGVMPGNPGNAMIAGHRNTYSGAFKDLHQLAYGDAIYVDIPGQPTAVYEVRGRAIVTPANVAVAAPTDGVRLTLVSCHPLNSDRYRLIVQAEMVEGAWLDKAVNRANWKLKLS